jgi:hypothetical protein
MAIFRIKDDADELVDRPLEIVDAGVEQARWDD